MTTELSTVPRLRWRHFAGVVGGVTLALLVFEIGHTLEHVVQVGAWFADPNAPAAMTPWGMWLADQLTSALGRVTTVVPGMGMELLHLVGNALFLLGLVCLLLVVRRHRLDTGRWLRAALVLQGLHVMEHAVLTLTLQTGGRALGLSNLFGLFEAGTPSAVAYRVWFHFVVNGVAALLTVAALWTAGRPERRRAAAAVNPGAVRIAGVITVAVLSLAISRGATVLLTPPGDAPGAPEVVAELVSSPAAVGHGH